MEINYAMQSFFANEVWYLLNVYNLDVYNIKILRQ